MSRNLKSALQQRFKRFIDRADTKSNIPNVIEKLAFDKEAAQICVSERVTIVRAQAPRSEAQICCEADAVKSQFFNCVRYSTRH